MSIGGILGLKDTGLTPGTYRFEVQTVSQVKVTAEPGTILLLGSGLLGLAGISLRKQQWSLTGNRCVCFFLILRAILESV